MAEISSNKNINTSDKLARYSGYTGSLRLPVNIELIYNGGDLL